MDSKLFKSLFNTVAKSNNFSYQHSAWFRESSDSIIVLSLQKSNYDNLYYLNIKTFVRGLFGESYNVSKTLTKDTGHIFRREPADYQSAFNLDSELTDEQREKELVRLFKSFLNPYCEIMLSKGRIIQEHRRGNEQYYLLPAVKEELEAI